MGRNLGWVKSLCALGLGLGSSLHAQTTTPHFFRHDGGVANRATTWPDTFDAAELVWRQPLAPGNSSPCIADDRIVVTTYDAKQVDAPLQVVALDRRTGQVMWHQAAPVTQLEMFHPVGSPAASTPAWDGQHVYAFFGSYGLLCYDRDGQRQWAKTMGPFQDEFGAASSPVIVDDYVILAEDHDVSSHLIALNRHTGAEVWKVARDEFARSYSTPVIWKQSGRVSLVVAGSLQLVGYEPSTGAKQWWVRGLSRTVDTTPVVADDALYLATWTPGGDEGERIEMPPFPQARDTYDQDQDGLIGETELPDGDIRARFFRMDVDQNKQLDEREWNRYVDVFARAQNVALCVRGGGEGDITESHVAWVYRRGLPTVASPVIYQQTLFMIKDGGLLTSLDTASGAVLKQGRLNGPGSYYASLVAGDGKILAISEAGYLTIVKAQHPWEILASHEFNERVMATPVFADGRVYVRTDEALYCFTSKSGKPD